MGLKLTKVSQPELDPNASKAAAVLQLFLKSLIEPEAEEMEHFSRLQFWKKIKGSELEKEFTGSNQSHLAFELIDGGRLWIGLNLHIMYSPEKDCVNKDWSVYRQLRTAIEINQLLQSMGEERVVVVNPGSVLLSHLEIFRFGVQDQSLKPLGVVECGGDLVSFETALGVTEGSANDRLPPRAPAELPRANPPVKHATKLTLLAYLPTMASELQSGIPYAFQGALVGQTGSWSFNGSRGREQLIITVAASWSEKENCAMKDQCSGVVIKLGELELTPEQMLEVRPGTTLSFAAPEVLDAVVEVGGVAWAHAEVEWTGQEISLHITKMAEER